MMGLTRSCRVSDAGFDIYVLKCDDWRVYKSLFVFLKNIFIGVLEIKKFSQVL